MDTPFHRFADGEDLSDVGLDRVAALPGLVVRAPDLQAVDADRFAGLEVRGRAVLVHTGWARHWGADAYFEDHPFLTEAAAACLVEAGAALVGIDSHNIDDTRTRAVRHTPCCSAQASRSANICAGWSCCRIRGSASPPPRPR